MVRHRIQIRFAKEGDLRLISHRDLIRTMERLLRRAGLPLARTEGFHPRPRMSFPSALSVGISGAREVLEIELAEQRPPDELLAALAAQAVAGLRFLSVDPLPSGTRAAQAVQAVYEIPVPAERSAGLTTRVAALLAAERWPVRRPHDDRELDLRAGLLDLAFHDGTLQIRLAIERQASVSPRLVLEALELGDLEALGCRLTRSDLVLAS
ncbi:MAG: TIGR03936 family radical SAM-associated protein [Pirellulales bacterium]|nr:TIGR03936 family radical SAM-associated protein [Pirellulales bacterium]